MQSHIHTCIIICVSVFSEILPILQYKFQNLKYTKISFAISLSLVIFSICTHTTTGMCWLSNSAQIISCYVHK